MDKTFRRGEERSDRTGTGTISVFAPTPLVFDIEHYFPLITAKRVPFKSVVAELLWFIEGSTDNKRLNELGSTIWDEWAGEDGDLGPIYGKQWRRASRFEKTKDGTFCESTIDQLGIILGHRNRILGNLLPR